MKISKKIRDQIRANVMFKWDILNAKFNCGERVTVKNRIRNERAPAKDWRGCNGTIVAVSSVEPDLGLIRGDGTYCERGWTKYYIQNGGVVRGFYSYNLK